MATKRTTATRSRGVAGVSTHTALLVVTALLCTIGVIMVWSASSVVAISLYGSSWSLIRNELAFMVVGGVALLAMRKFGYENVGRLASPIMWVAFAGLAAVETVGVSTMGSARWIRLPMGFTLQPSEIMKFALVVYISHAVARGMSEGRAWGEIAKWPAGLTLLAAGIVIMQPDMGTATVLVAIALGIFTVAGLPKRTLLATVGAIILAGLFAAVAMPYRMARITSFLHRSANDQAGGYQVTQSLVGFGSGGLTGAGLGNSKEKWGLLPNPHTDFIYSIIGEELGLIGALFVLMCFVALVAIGWRIAMNARDRQGKLMATGITIWIGTEAIINIAASIGLMPVTGIPLPFISFGGTALICTLAAIGLLADIARREAQLRPGVRRPRSSERGGAAKPRKAQAKTQNKTRSKAPQKSRTARTGTAASARSSSRPAARRPGASTPRPAPRRSANGGR